MSYEVRVRRAAVGDIEDAAVWYEMQRVGLGGEFIDEVERALDKITDDPAKYRVLYRDTRRTILQRFPFGVFYRIQQQVIVVVAVMHSSRDPHRWKTRA